MCPTWLIMNKWTRRYFENILGHMRPPSEYSDSPYRSARVPATIRTFVIPTCLSESVRGTFQKHNTPHTCTLGLGEDTYRFPLAGTNVGESLYSEVVEPLLPHLCTMHLIITQYRYLIAPWQHIMTYLHKQTCAWPCFNPCFPIGSLVARPGTKVLDICRGARWRPIAFFNDQFPLTDCFKGLDSPK